MFYRDRLDDDYEIYQRHHSYTKDDLEILVADAQVKKSKWYTGILSNVGDGLISAGSALKKHNGDMKSTTLSTMTR
jgi:hypothetical protein